VRPRVLTAILAVVAVLPVTVAANASTHTAKVVSRQSRTSDVAIAGANIYIWSSHNSETRGTGCTLSFVVRSKSTGGRGALTAGHCVATIDGGPSYLVHQTESMANDSTAPGDLLGKITKSSFVMNENGDSAFVALAPGVAGRPLVFTGGPRAGTSIPVAGLLSPETGMQVCYSGAATGEHCGFTIQGGSQTVSFKSRNGHVQIGNEWRASSDSCTSRRGDSGSPVYVYKDNAAYAVGILSGGQVKPGQCPFYFTPVKLALKVYGLTLVTSSTPTATS
jgi:V8-like Glu-specific endopeptidase